MAGSSSELASYKRLIKLWFKYVKKVPMQNTRRSYAALNNNEEKNIGGESSLLMRKNIHSEANWPHHWLDSEYLNLTGALSLACHAKLSFA